MHNLEKWTERRKIAQEEPTESNIVMCHVLRQVYILRRSVIFSVSIGSLDYNEGPILTRCFGIPIYYLSKFGSFGVIAPQIYGRSEFLSAIEQ